MIRELDDPKGGERLSERFDIPTGRTIAGKYQVNSLLGVGWEGEVYLVEELQTGIERAAKFFYPERNVKNRRANNFAKKLHRNRHHHILVQYLHQERVKLQGHDVTCLVSEFIEGQILTDYIKNRDNSLESYEALSILWEICSGLEPVHQAGEYHGDLHTDNILIRRQGIHFHIKLIDSFDWKDSRSKNVRQDVVDLVRVLYDMVGGRDRYSEVGPEIKGICCGLKTSLINKKFKNAGQLRSHLDSFLWEY
ncbi:protein kinase domain-containing protein [Pseudobacteriovorax antillogorgiicola]|uniref:Protein kinase domain-containing protein n=1 Tax=Pseudobacteriovorax antillogorgiicola TaxID=1513793 RepID=A0A1Y6BK12_9BACT|nr:protein kinase [Pseudobacteriovorax antillogorgiicola]TCS56465.1 protein kinase-like protein [Pseudobacteriovorax antillogorgiicola]SMF05142.1 Protein kinase domain-containing protein [Pseudobacteriovorax antillogorgiicola]